ncbi:MAG: serine/threonine-protein kinase [Polyangia bacterium]
MGEGSPKSIPELGRYRDLVKIGEGSMGAVYRARDPVLDRAVAIKLLTAQGPGFVSRIQREARALAKVSHPNVVQIHDSGIDPNGAPYFVMEHLHGRSLDALLEERGRLPHQQVRELVRQAAQGLSAAHAAGLIHRDIKPANLFLETNGNLKILDFGIARSVEQNAAESGDVRVLGTPYYMAPELLNAEPVDLRADVYALGLTAFHLLTGRPPFISDTPFGVASMQLTEPLPDPRTLAAGLPEDLCWLIERMAEKDRSTRIQSCDEVARLLGLPPPELSALSQSTSQAALPVRSPWILAIAALLLGALALAGALLAR